ncbi:MAG: histidine phosphatase family protein [Anaerocolumna sp.]
MQIIFVRHGESKANALNGNEYKMFTGQWDCELTAHGTEQAKKLQNNSIFYGVDAYFSSDLMRAQKTAKHFADKPIILDERIRERSLGDFDGKLVEEIQNDKRYNKYFGESEYVNFRHDFAVKAPNGENYSDVCQRVSSFWNESVDKGYQKIVIVSHMCTIRCLMKVIQGLSDEETLKIKVPKCEPIIIEV